MRQQRGSVTQQQAERRPRPHSVHFTQNGNGEITGKVSKQAIILLYI